MLLNFFLDAAVSSINSADACLNDHATRLADLDCGSQNKIEVIDVMVGDSSNSDCLVDRCPYANTNLDPVDTYFKNVTQTCNSLRACTVSSETLRSFRFPDCGPAFAIRNTLKVYYNCNPLGKLTFKYHTKSITSKTALQHAFLLYF